MKRSPGFTLLEVSLAVLVGIALMAGIASAFNMYRSQALVQQAKTELQQVRNQLSLAAYRLGYPCSPATMSIVDNVASTTWTISGAAFYVGATASATVTSIGPPAQVNVNSTAGFWPGQPVEIWALPSGSNRWVAEGTGIFNGPANNSSPLSISILNSTVQAAAVSVPAMICSGLKCNLAGVDTNGGPIPFLSMQPPVLPSGMLLPAGAGIADPFLNALSVRWLGGAAPNNQPADTAPAPGSAGFVYTGSGAGADSQFGGLAMDGNCNVSWVLPDPQTISGGNHQNLPNLAGDPPGYW